MGRSIFSSRDGKVPESKKVPGTLFVVDAFQYLQMKPSEHWFLSHFHADHYGGLSKKAFTTEHGKIYCSQVTANLCKRKLGIQEQFMVILSTHFPLSIDIPGGTVKVTVFDANHCPGALLLLFEVQKRGEHTVRILHCGDMRYTPRMQCYKGIQNVDHLYLDTTFCSEKYTFPPQNEMIEWIADYVQSKWESTLIFLVGTYSIGKEKVLMAISKRMGCKIYVSGVKRGDLALLDLPCDMEKTFTTKKELSKVHVTSLGKLSYTNLDQLAEEYASYASIVCIRPTGWALNKKKTVSISRKGHIEIAGVPYSEHSSYSELLEFVKYVRPKHLIPTVNYESPKELEKMKLLLDPFLDHSSNKNKITSYFRPLSQHKRAKPDPKPFDLNAVDVQQQIELYSQWSQNRQ